MGVAAALEVGIYYSWQTGGVFGLLKKTLKPSQLTAAPKVVVLHEF